MLQRKVAESDLFQPLAAIRERGDTRKPVLYLRPFGTDERTTRFLSGRSAHQVPVESAVLEPLAKLGPVLAVGRPEEDHPPSSGALRVYAGEVYFSRDWQPLFRRLLGE